VLTKFAVKDRIFQIACVIAVSTASILPSAALAADTSLGGTVRNRSGVPQIDALVELLGADRTPVAAARTDARGAFLLTNLLPGVYQLRASEDTFLPSVRQHLRIAPHQRTLADVTLSTLFEATDWLPAEKRSASEPDDDWKWTLRSSANRPLLRFDDDGPVLVYPSRGEQGSGEVGSSRATQTRVSAHAGARIFGESGVQNAVEFERTAGDGRHALLRAELGGIDGAPSEFVAGYEHALIPGHELRAAAAFLDQPRVVGSTAGPGLEAAVVRTAQTMQLLSDVNMELGNEIVAMGLAGQQMGGEQIQSHPFASLTWQGAHGQVRYSLTTAQQVQSGSAIADDGTLLPRAAVRNGRLAPEHGLHQELRWSRDLDSSGSKLELAVFNDRWANSIVNGGGTISTADAASGDLLMDPVAGRLRAAAQSYAGAGFLAQAQTRISPNTTVSVAYALGPALEVAGPSGSAVSVSQVLASMHAHTTQMATLAASGKVARTGTQWRASYRLQHRNELTPVDPCDTPLESAYLSMFLRQRIHRGRVFPGGMEAVVDVRNLLAQGYYPFVTPDGSLLYFAQAGRSMQAGIAFTF